MAGLPKVCTCNPRVPDDSRPVYNSNLGITVPSVESQIDNIRMAYNRAGLEPDKTKYVECHGTGTQAGDKRELRAIGEAIAKHRDRPLLVGSLKTNIGHLEGAAGVAGLIKAVLVLEKGLIPKHLNMKEPNPDIKWKEWKVKVRHVVSSLSSTTLIVGEGARRLSSVAGRRPPACQCQLLRFWRLKRASHCG